MFGFYKYEFMETYRVDVLLGFWTDIFFWEKPRADKKLLQKFKFFDDVKFPISNLNV